MSNLKAKASLAFLNDSVINKVKRGKIVGPGVIGQAAKLPHLPHASTILTEVNERLDSISLEVSAGNHAAVAAQVLIEKEWDSKFKDTAQYVTTAAGGNKETILASGFDCTSTETVLSVEPTSLTNFSSKEGAKTGTCDLEADPQKSATAYMFALVPPEALVQQVGSTIKITIGTKTMYIVLDTHHKTEAVGMNSEETLNAYGVAFNLRGAGPIVKTSSNIKPK